MLKLVFSLIHNGIQSAYLKQHSSSLNIQYQWKTRTRLKCGKG